VTTKVLSEEEKEAILRTLEVDRRFRYALMGLLGFSEVLNRITKLEEGYQRLEEGYRSLAEGFRELMNRFAKLEEGYQELMERFAKLEEVYQKLMERFAKLEERYQRLEERQQKLEEGYQRLEERYQRLEERFARIEERQQRLEERQQKLEERMLRVEEELKNLREEMNELRLAVITIGNRFGVMAEDAFRSALSGILRKYFGVEAKRWTYFDRDGVAYGYSSVVEVDVVVKDSVHILIEVKSRVDRGDVFELVNKAKLYERVEGVKPKLVIVAGYVDKGAYEAARMLGVEIYTYLGEEQK